MIPGITAGIAAPAAAGIPVTDRRQAPGVALVTRHSREGGRGPDWGALGADDRDLHEAGTLRRTARRAARRRAARHDWAALIEQGCTPAMRAHRTTLARLADDAIRLRFAAPALIVVGDVTWLGAAVETDTLRIGSG